MFIVYVGGDLADDDAVRTIHRHGTAAAIGHRTLAAYRIEPDQVDALLDTLSAARLAAPGAPREACATAVWPRPSD